MWRHTVTLAFVDDKHKERVNRSSMSEINILDLPTELLVKICSGIQFKDLCNLELSSKHFRCLIVEHQLYRQLLHSLPDCKALSKKISRERVEELKEMEGENSSEEEENVVQSRLYKSLLVQQYRPEHYHCKGNYQYYMQVFQDEEPQPQNVLKGNVSKFWINFSMRYLFWIVLLLLLLIALFIAS